MNGELTSSIGSINKMTFPQIPAVYLWTIHGPLYTDWQQMCCMCTTIELHLLPFMLLLVLPPLPTLLSSNSTWFLGLRVWWLFLDLCCSVSRRNLGTTKERGGGWRGRTNVLMARERIASGCSNPELSDAIIARRPFSPCWASVIDSVQTGVICPDRQ